jgi:predicted nucleic acid-binding protein
MPGKAFDTNVVVYAYSQGSKANIAWTLLRDGGVVCVQNLNEFANVARRKLGFSWDEIENAVDDLVALLGPPLPLDFDIHCAGLKLAKRYNLSVYDGLILAAALNTDCDTFWSEDMHDGLVIDNRLRIVNPFAQTAR